MKKLYIYLLFVVWLFSGCDSVTNLQPQQNPNDIIPQAAVNAIRQTYPDATKIRFSTIEKDVVFQSDFDLKIDKMSAVVNHLGIISEMYKQTAEVSLPESIKQYIATNYINAVIINVCQQVNKDGETIGYKVTIKSKEGKNIVMIFDKTGALTLLISDDKNRNTPGGKPPKLYFIDKSELPQAIKDFLTSKHGDYTCIKAAVVLDDDTKNYSVLISKNLTTYDYLFDEKGNVLKSNSFGINAPTDRIEDKPLTFNDLPSSIKNYINTAYKGWTFERGIYFIQNGVIQAYNVLITYDKKQYSLQFDGKGNFVKKEEIGKNTQSNNNKYEVRIVLPKDLPNTIINYLNTKHNDFKFIQTSIIIEKDKRTYWITVLQGRTAFDYTFDEKGNFLTVKEINMKFSDNNITDKPLELKDLPNKIDEFLDKNFKNWVFQKAITVYEDGKLLGYSIAIKVGNDYYYVNFDANLNFLSARRG